MRVLVIVVVVDDADAMRAEAIKVVVNDDDDVCGVVIGVVVDDEDEVQEEMNVVIFAADVVFRVVVIAMSVELNDEVRSGRSGCE